MDRRLTPATDRVALRGSGIARDEVTDGRPMRLAAPVADLLRAPGGARDRQLLHGADVTLIEERDGWGFVQAVADGYCGWVTLFALTADMPPITHRVTAPATHLYPAPDFKQPERGSLPMGARLSVTATEGRFAQLADGLFVPIQHISERPAEDPAQVALRLLGTPYLWGGNSRGGIDCSGLAQAALHGAGIACPGDSDLQRNAFPVADNIQRGDLLFWPGHVAMALDETTMIHATAWTMSVITENIAAAIARIAAAGDGPFLGARRPRLDDRIAFP
ncbi:MULTISPECIES: NlpC/P60 family protein [unclassified Paracoccus (in: a-proteobacteria)]|uniref:C40 family peptidase n=1 Tax=unclassified Paracoccus (in: a-proteobacteria) TaxID=2688777 RepID=UPI001603F046|nr:MULTISPECIES: NlpC/P60 family protein [unclassified Paracoccus (in: a-proteobacteria)]MBB1492098.1 C40 family peptidase [Paracoccus sp. MC1854]MBB1497984.1 C40 family peptidase [Paracoccus sp. MC1862]QQO44367.1 C40 family peptidase [Paracoccus sp. MC1862]